MCDCSQEQHDEIVEKVHPETITIFLKSRTPYRPEKNVLELAASDGADWIPFNSVQSSSHATSNSTKSSSASTESSSESSRTYKFVCPMECDCSGKGEEELKLPLVCLEADRIKDANEKELDIEFTLAIIKPEAVIYRKEIEHRIYAEGFEICQRRWLQLSPEQVSEFYDDHFGELTFPQLVLYMSSGPIMVFVLVRQNAVEEWRMIIGPTAVTEARLYFPDSIRARYSRRGEDFRNVVHGSKNRERAEKEIRFFFSECKNHLLFIIEPLLRDERAEDFLWEVINPILAEGLTLCCKSKPDDPILWLAHWLLLNNPNKPKLPEDLALIPT